MNHTRPDAKIKWNVEGRLHWPHASGTQRSNSCCGGWTCIEVIAVQIVIIVLLIVGLLVGQESGAVAGIAAGMAAAFVGGLIVRTFYAWSSRLREREMLELRENYPAVYRIRSVPAESPCVKADGTEIAVGDYGWEAEPIFNDGLIYLQGLTEVWDVAWYAGFRPDQIDRICQKPRSQYYLPYSWYCAGADPPPCPYPVLHSPETTLGRPWRVDFPFVQGVKVNRSRDRGSSHPFGDAAERLEE